MNPTELLEKISQSLGSAASVKSVYGESIHAEGKTVVPVARVSYGFGAGSGRKPSKAEDRTAEQPEAGGGWDGARACPAGVLEITPSQTRFMPYTDSRWLVLRRRDHPGRPSAPKVELKPPIAFRT